MALFGEKVKEMRRKNQLSQKELAEKMKVSLRTIRGWETDGVYPKKHSQYTELAQIFGCDVNYLLAENEAFTAEVSENYGSRGTEQARQILSQAAAMFAGGELSDEDKTAFMDELQMLYLDSKIKAKKYTRKDYREE